VVRKVYKRNLQLNEMPKKVKAKVENTDKKLTQAEYEKAVLDLADKGLTSEKIGEALKRQGIHPKEFKKKISEIMGSKYTNPDLKNIKAKLEKIKKHTETNKKDQRAKREKERVFSQLRKLKIYLKEPIE
jgi:ribosomal protein S15P/S13E